jgi:hypothetical protein
MMAVVAIVLPNLMNQFSAVLVSLTFIIQAHRCQIRRILSLDDM